MKESSSTTSSSSASASQAGSWLGKLDAWMAEHPFHPRLIPFVVWVLMILLMSFVREPAPLAYVTLQLVQIGVVSWLLWRYRALTPEVTLSFHWLAVPVAIGGAAAWMGLGYGMEQVHAWFVHEPTPYFEDMPAATAWVAMVSRLVGMAVVVAIFEELFFRSALLRALQRPREAKIALVQFLDDLPVIGDWWMRTRVSKWADQFPRPLAEAFERTPLGAVTVFSVVSTVVLWSLISHAPRDWPGTVACGLLFIWLVWYTNRGERKMGLGPVIWAHGLTNAILWGYTLGTWLYTGTGDWRFL